MAFISVLLLSTIAGALFVKQARAEMIIVPNDYSTIQEAVNAAVDGDTIFVRKGTYEEKTLVINKTLSLIGEDAYNTKINLQPSLVWTGGWHSVVPLYAYEAPIEIHANDVELLGFTITSKETNEAVDLDKIALGKTNPAFIVLGRPIILATGNRTKIASNIIKTGLKVEGVHQNITENILTDINCDSFYSIIASNNLEVGNHGIGIDGSYNLVYNNTVTDALGYNCGITLKGNGNIVANNTVTDNYSGISIYGTGSNNFVYSNIITHNVYGLAITGGNNNTILANDLVDNSCGVEIGYSESSVPNCTLYHNNFIGSAEQVSTRAKSTYIPGVWSEPFYVTGFFDNGKEGNYWSDYTGKDNDGNGIGDIPYVIDAERQDSYPLMVPFDIYSASVFVICPENNTYTTASVPLNFTVYKPTSWIGYSLDGQDNVTINGNITLAQLPIGLHSITVYVKDTFGNTGVSKTIHFTIAEPFPTALVVAAIASVIVIGAVILLLFKMKKARFSQKLS